MVYTLSNGLRDREYSKFSDIQTGSLTAVNVNVNSLVKVYSFSTGSLAALNTSGTTSPALAGISGGNFESYTNAPIIGQLKAIDWQKGNNTAGSLFIQISGGAATQVWGTITRDITNSFTVFPVATCVTTTDDSTISGNTVWYSDIYLNNVLKIVGSDFGKLKGASGLSIIYT